MVPLSVAAYLILGLGWNLWHPYWLIIPGAALLAGGLHGLFNMKNRPVIRTIESVVWPLIVLTYLLLGMLCNLWHPGWAIFPIAGVLDGVANTIYSAVRKDDGDRDEEADDR